MKILRDGKRHDIVTTQIPLPVLGSPTYNELQDFLDKMNGAGIVDGGVVSDGGSGTVNISAAKGFIRATDNAIAQLLAFDIAAATGLSLTDNALNWIYIDYNSGSPVFAATVTFADVNTNTRLMVGRAYRTGTTVHILNAGQKFQAYQTVACKKDFEVYGVVRASGAITSGTGTRNLGITAGTFYCAHNRFTTAAFDSSGADRFTYAYYNGAAWVEVAAQAQIDNTNWNNIASGLVALTANRYGVHWVYMENDGHVVVVYGQGDYTLAQATLAQPPASLPPRLVSTSLLIAKVIIQKSAAAFTSVENPFTNNFTGSNVANHNDLGNIQGGAASEYYHLTNLQNSKVQTLGKTPALLPEFPGAVLEALSGSGTNSILVTSEHEAGPPRRNFYRGTTGQASTQDLDLVVQVKLSDTWNGWDATQAVRWDSRMSATPGATGIELRVYDAAGTLANTPAKIQGTSWTTTTLTAANLATGTFAAGDIITLAFRLYADQAKNADLGKVLLKFAV